MSEVKMPVAEAEVSLEEHDERSPYELAFHILPTVAEEEVTRVFEDIKTHITKAGGELFDEEAPQHIELAYEILRHLEGKNRKFGSAHFGWVRFRVLSSAIPALGAEMEDNPNILRHILIKLTKSEEAHPFRFHEALAAEKMVTTVEESKVVPDFTTVREADTTSEEKEESGEVDDAEIEKALEEKEV